MMNRTCRKCGVVARIEDFHKNKTYACGHASICKICHRRAGKQYREANPDREKNYRRENRPLLLRQYRARKLLRKYGMSPAQFDEKLVQQGGKCAACEKVLSGSRRPPVDHNHLTGEIRGILCNGCNLALGLLRDDADIVLKLAEYRKRYL